VKHEPSPATFIPNQKGGQNLKDEDNFVYRKYRGRADESAGVWYICVRKDALKCPALVLLDPDRMLIAKVRVVDPDPTWIRIKLSCWIRIRIQEGKTDLQI
jgi:hypothetical protein